MIIKEEIFSKHFNGNNATIRFCDLPDDIRERDIIEIHRDEGFFSENNSYDPYTLLEVHREREETEEEIEARREKERRYREDSRKKRYETYLKLKEEFEREEKI